MYDGQLVKFKKDSGLHVGWNLCTRGHEVIAKDERSSWLVLREEYHGNTEWEVEVVDVSRFRFKKKHQFDQGRYLAAAGTCGWWSAPSTHLAYVKDSWAGPKSETWWRLENPKGRVLTIDDIRAGSKFMIVKDGGVEDGKALSTARMPHRDLISAWVYVDAWDTQWWTFG